MSINLLKDSELKQWLVDLKTRIRQSQIKAMIKVNDEMLRLYWDLGRDIVVRQMDAKWGSGFYSQLSKELKSEFPDMQGFSATNLNYCKRFYQFYSNDPKFVGQIVNLFPTPIEEKQQSSENKENIIHPQVGGEFEINPLFSIPWGHHKWIIDKCKSIILLLDYLSVKQRIILMPNTH